MDSFLRSVLLVWLAVLSSGCRSCDLVEAELRYQNNRVYELEGIVLQKDAEIHSLRASVEAGYADEESDQDAPEVIYRELAINRISLGPTTGGRDLDRDGADDALQVMVAPHDYDDDVFKCPGEAEITLLEFLPNGVKRPIGEWSLDQQELRDAWRSTFLGQGYQVVLPWQQAPENPKLRAVIRFATVDGRLFETERDFTIATADATDVPNEHSAPGQPAEPAAPDERADPVTDSGEPTDQTELPRPDPPTEPLRRKRIDSDGVAQPRTAGRSRVRSIHPRKASLSADAPSDQAPRREGSSMTDETGVARRRRADSANPTLSLVKKRIAARAIPLRSIRPAMTTLLASPLRAATAKSADVRGKRLVEPESVSDEPAERSTVRAEQSGPPAGQPVRQRTAKTSISKLGTDAPTVALQPAVRRPVSLPTPAPAAAGAGHSSRTSAPPKTKPVAPDEPASPIAQLMIPFPVFGAMPEGQ